MADSWLTLVSGREVAQHGLPHHEVITTIARGRVWTDQQWLAQLIFYGLDRVGGLGLTVVFHSLMVAGAVAVTVIASRVRGASARMTLLAAIVCLLVAPWSWQLRAQSVALPLFAADAGLDGDRSTPVVAAQLPRLSDSDPLGERARIRGARRHARVARRCARARRPGAANRRQDAVVALAPLPPRALDLRHRVTVRNRSGRVLQAALDRQPGFEIGPGVEGADAERLSPRLLRGRGRSRWWSPSGRGGGCRPTTSPCSR